jgi:hypothetical protein
VDRLGAEGSTQDQDPPGIYRGMYNGIVAVGNSLGMGEIRRNSVVGLASAPLSQGR